MCLVLPLGHLHTPCLHTCSPQSSAFCHEALTRSLACVSTMFLDFQTIRQEVFKMGSFKKYLLLFFFISVHVEVRV